MSAHLNYVRSRSDRLLRVAFAVLVFVALVGYFALVTQGSLDLVRPFLPAPPWGFVFNKLLSHLLEGRFDIDPQIIGSEAFLHNGRTFAYFVIFPLCSGYRLFLSMRSEQCRSAKYPA